MSGFIQTLRPSVFPRFVCRNRNSRNVAIKGGGTRSGSFEPTKNGTPDPATKNLRYAEGGLTEQNCQQHSASYYDTTMKPVITKDEVAKAISNLAGQGKKPTLVALHAALDNKGSMSTLVRLKAELEAEAQSPKDSSAALEAFREVWSLARNEGREEQEQALAELRNTLQALAAENERLDEAVGTARKRADELQEAKSEAEKELQSLHTSVERDLSQATSTMRDAGLQAAKALQELADARGSHATMVSSLQAELTTAQRSAHEFELELVRARALLEARG